MAIFLGHQTELAVASPWPDQPLLIGIEYLQAISLFFLLSGIPLARLYKTKVQNPAGRYEFWRKRLARLSPIYYFTLTLNFVLLLALAGIHQVNLKAAVESLLGCAFLLQGWFVLRFITVGGVLWQVAVFAYGPRKCGTLGQSREVDDRGGSTPYSVIRCCVEAADRGGGQPG